MQAVIYSRISDDPRGKAAGVERQVDECRALATARGADVVEVLVDNDISATTGKRRPGYERVLDLIEAGMVDTVVVWHTDRLYRLPRDLEPLIALADGRTLRFLTVTASEIDLNTPSGRMVARMLAAASANEVEHKAERQRSASDQRASKGEPVMRPGYGFRRQPDGVVADPAEAAALREAARRVLEGEPLRRIARDFQARGIPSPSGSAPWQAVTLRQTLKRPALAGLRVHRGVVVGDALGDRILDRDTHDRLVALFSDPSRAQDGVGRPASYLLTGIALCGLCGGRMRHLKGWTAKADGSPTKAQPEAYQCRVCFKVRRKKDGIDEFIEEHVIRRLEAPDAAELFTRGDPALVREAREAIAAIDARLATAADSFADGDIDGEQLRRISAKLRGEREKLAATVTRALPPAIPADLVGDQARAKWEALDLDVKRAVVDTLMTVTILPGGRGIRGFKPELIAIDWK